MIDDPRVIYSINANVEQLSHDLARAMFNDDLNDLYEDEIVNVIALADCFFGKYIAEYSPMSISLEHSFPGTDFFLNKINPNITPYDLQQAREAICLRFDLYEKEFLLRGYRGYVNVIAVFSIIAEEYVKIVSSVEFTGLSDEELRNPRCRSAFAKAFNRLTRMLPELDPVDRNPTRVTPPPDKSGPVHKSTGSNKSSFFIFLKLILFWGAVIFVLYWMSSWK